MNLRPDSKTYKFLKNAGWAYIVLAILIMLVFAGIRIADMIQPSDMQDAYTVRYLEHQWVGLLHLVPGLVFLVFAPLQFVIKIRSRHITYHRMMGRFLLGCGLFSGVMGVVSAFILPAFGGLGTQAAAVLFGAIFTFALARAFYHIRRKHIASHREWMIRAFSLASAVASIRIFIGLMQGFGGLGLEEVFATCFWLGFSVNLLVAETWINVTRPRRES